jgi:hypothetical protein
MDDVEELELSGSGAQRQRKMVATFREWATDSSRFVLDDDVSPVYLLTVAAEHLEMLGQPDEALCLAEQARSLPQAGAIEVHPTLISFALARGDREEANRLADEVRRSGLATAYDVEQIAESFELAGLLVEAQRPRLSGRFVAAPRARLRGIPRAQHRRVGVGWARSRSRGLART